MAVKLVTFNGLASAGTISVPGLKIGDRMIALQESNGTYIPIGGWSQIITVKDELMQSATGDNSSLSFVALFERDVVIS